MRIKTVYFVIITFILFNFMLFGEGPDIEVNIYELVIMSREPANSSAEPSWTFLKRAENLKEQGNYAAALIEAKRAKVKFIEEKLSVYYEDIKAKHRDKTGYELKKMVRAKEKELKLNDNYPQFHELMGDLYTLTDFLIEAEKEYKIALSQKVYFDYPDKVLEIKYKLADVYGKQNRYDLEDIIYREILTAYDALKPADFWARIKVNIRKDQTLSHVFRIYRVEGIQYLQALYKVGRRSALLKRGDDSLFYLSNAAIVWMTYYNELIKKRDLNFQYTAPVDFINYVTKNNLFEYISEDYIIHEIMFYIGYNYFVTGDEEIMRLYFDLAKMFSKGTDKEEEIADRIAFLMSNRDHRMTYDEIVD